MDDRLAIIAIVCIAITAIVLGSLTIFAVLAYSKDKASLKLSNKSKDLIDNEISIDIEDHDSKNPKK
ncbi:MAG: hypothetical protein K0R54_6052 [Clostridiaceae bacterium]|jgi:hypothetical protein|nr:hypothetical protein [Clostridiaceae bacterium]